MKPGSKPKTGGDIQSNLLRFVDQGKPALPESGSHFVQFYESDDVLINSVGVFIGAGLGSGEAAVVIGTEAHRNALEARLAGQGIDIPGVKARGQFLALDARETLRTFMRNGVPDEHLFMQSIGGVIAKSATAGTRLRAYGEMVALLWSDGNHDAAIRLEELWTKLGVTLEFSLYCAYPIHGFGDPAHDKHFDRICTEHTGLIPAESYQGSASTEERMRAIAILQQKGMALEAEIVERRRVESELSESESRFRTMADSAPVMLWMSDAEGDTTYVNRPWIEFTGRPLETELALDATEGIHAEDRTSARGAFDRAILAQAPFRIEYRYRRFDGAYRWILDTGTPRFSDDGSFLGFIGSGIDITGLKDTEDQLRQAQKMEAVGRLAGGIAHDFNNLLTAINGYSEMALGLVEDGENLKDYLEEIRRSGERAASLTQQLLAYSRKQILAPTVFDLNETVGDMDRMLRRLIGEHIRMESTLAPDLGLVRADPGQIQQIILNLVLNSRDAMPAGGRLAFETSNVILDKGQAGSASGPHAMLAVRDTGPGMPSDVKSRKFEPFYTTKEVGKGTGLGLSSVYGIIKQSGGSIAVESEVGKGTEFRIYLPIVEANRDADGSASERAPRIEERNETILLVEDEETVRRFIQHILIAQGYRVLEANDGPTAMEIGAREAKIDLLLTDVVMPSMNGAALADALKPGHPDIRILFMSGYTDDIFLPGGVIDPGSKFLQKPFGQSDLQARIRELLDAKPIRPV